MVEGDTEPPLILQLLDENSEPISLEGKTVLLNMGKRIRDRPMSVVDVGLSVVRYDWLPSDTEAGVWYPQIVLEWGDGRRRTIPNSKLDAIRVIIDRRL